MVIERDRVGKDRGGKGDVLFEYRLKKNGDHEAHVRERMKKAMEVMGQVWEIGKRRFRGN